MYTVRYYKEKRWDMHLWSTSNLRNQRQPREAPSGTSHGADTSTIYVSTKIAFASIQ